MFISKVEKEAIFSRIHFLENQASDLQFEIIRLREGRNYQRKPSEKTPEAPYGIKKDGTARKQPGRPKLIMKVGAA